MWLDRVLRAKQTNNVTIHTYEPSAHNFWELLCNLMFCENTHLHNLAVGMKEKNVWLEDSFGTKKGSWRKG